VSTSNSSATSPRPPCRAVPAHSDSAGQIPHPATAESGFVVCARATILAMANDPAPPGFWPARARPIHVLRNQDLVS
jgi:hypothetical protein